MYIYVCGRTFSTDDICLVLTIQSRQNPVENGPDTASVAVGLISVIIAVAVAGVAILLIKRYLNFEYIFYYFYALKTFYFSNN